MEEIYLSVVIPVYNEEESLDNLSRRLMPVLESLNKPFEVIYCNDGSSDKSLEILKTLQKKHPHVVRIIDLLGNHGQHMAIMAAFEQSRGAVIINLDADLQNPPEEIPKLLECYEAGHDMVGSYRLQRKDHALRHYGSRFANWLRGKITTLHMRDQGCMFRAYSREIVNAIIQGRDAHTFIPALGWKLAKNPCEVGLTHDPRTDGKSKYSLYELIRVSLDLATSFSLKPIQFVTFFGIIVSSCSLVLVLYMIGRRLIIGPEAEGVFTLLAILIFLVSVSIFSIGIIGEYVGRTFQAVSGRPRFIIREMYDMQKNTSPPKNTGTKKKKPFRSERTTSSSKKS